MLRGGGTKDLALIDIATFLASSIDILEVQAGMSKMIKPNKIAIRAIDLLKVWTIVCLLPSSIAFCIAHSNV
jgi:hypothetical protein